MVAAVSLVLIMVSFIGEAIRGGVRSAQIYPLSVERWCLAGHIDRTLNRDAPVQGQCDQEVKHEHKIKWTGTLFLLVNRILVWAASLPAGSDVGDQRHRPVFASPKGAAGGNLNLFVDSFPLTFRTVGRIPTASFRSSSSTTR